MKRPLALRGAALFFDNFEAKNQPTADCCCAPAEYFPSDANVSSKRMAKILAALASEGKYSAVEPAKLRFQAGQPHYSAERRTACMPTDRQVPNDLQAARLLLRNRVSYAAATSRLASTVAER